MCVCEYSGGCIADAEWRRSAMADGGLHSMRTAFVRIACIYVRTCVLSARQYIVVRVYRYACVCFRVCGARVYRRVCGSVKRE